MRNVFVPDAALDHAIGASPEPTPSVVRARIFRVNREVDPAGLAQKRAGNTKDKFALAQGDLESICSLPLAPVPAFPFAKERGNPIAPYFRAEKQVALKGQENRRAFGMLSKGKDRGADIAMRAED